MEFLATHGGGGNDYLDITMGNGWLSLEARNLGVQMLKAAGCRVEHQQTLRWCYHILIQEVVKRAVLMVMAYQPTEENTRNLA